jgi:hypothetical protein
MVIIHFVRTDAKGIEMHYLLSKVLLDGQEFDGSEDKIVYLRNWLILHR